MISLVDFSHFIAGMCRLVVYRGHKRPLLLADLLTRPEHSIIKQSVRCFERVMSQVNGDGFGVGFYTPGVTEPCVYVGTTPAWNNANLMRLADHVESCIIFAHVRAATPGLSTTESNCHPFVFGRLMWMHNGDVPAVHLFRRQVLIELPQTLFDHLTGHTDSELCFMIFIQELGSAVDAPSSHELAAAMQATVRRVQTLCSSTGDPRCVLNFVVSDGTSVVATRYAGGGAVHASLYYASGSGWESQHGEYFMSHRERVPYAHLIASEPLTPDLRDWVEIPRNDMCTITGDSDFLFQPLDLSGLEPQTHNLGRLAN